jgi:hypothetical protein
MPLAHQLAERTDVPPGKAQEGHSKEGVRHRFVLALLTVVRWQPEMVYSQLTLEPPFFYTEFVYVQVSVVTVFALEPMVQPGSNKGGAITHDGHRTYPERRY